MKVPVFVSCPTVLSESQERSRHLVLDELDYLGLEPRTLGRSDYPVDTPCREVVVLARRCSGGIVLGYAQARLDTGVAKPGAAEEAQLVSMPLPSPWNQLEAGILFTLGLPLLVFKEAGVTGGVFDLGAGDMFVHKMPMPDEAGTGPAGLRDVLQRWAGRVRDHYYRF